MDGGTPAGIGHNLGLPSPDAFTDYLKASTGDITTRILDLQVGANKVPAEIGADDEERVTDFIAQMKKALAEAEALRKETKGPIDALAKQVQGHFKGFMDPLQLAIAALERRLGVWLQKKRQAAEAEAKRQADAAAAAQAEADRLAAEAAKVAQAAETPEQRQAAAQALQQAQDAAQAAERAAAPKAEPVRAKGAYGAVGYTRKDWDFEIEDPSRIPLGFLMPDEKAIRAAIAEGVREIPGIKIFQTETTVVKGR